MSNRRKRFQDALSEDINNFTQDAITHGIDEAVDSAIEDKIMDAVEGAARRKFGNHPALIMLPEFIRAQRGYGPIIREDTSRQLRLDLGLEDEFPTIEEVEEALEDLDSSDLLDGVVSEWEQEIQDLVDEFEEEIEDLEETEDELPDTIEETRDEGERLDDDDDNDDEDDGDGSNRCWTISLGIGDLKVTFDTCREQEEVEQEEVVSDEPGLPPSPNLPALPKIPTGYEGWICPVFERIDLNIKRLLAVYDDGSISTTRAVIYKRWIGARVVGWGAWNSSETNKWILDTRDLESTKVRWKIDTVPPYAYYEEGNPQIRYSIDPEREFTGLFSLTYIYGWSFADTHDDFDFWDPQGKRVLCEYTGGYDGEKDPPIRSPFSVPIIEKKKEPIIEKKEKMNDECCKATLSLTRKIYNAVGGAEESLYPYEVTTGNSGDTTEINNIKERIDILTTEQQEAVDNNTLLQEIANVTGTSPTPLYPEGEGEDEVANLAEDVRKNKDSESLAKIANVIGSSENPLYPLEGKDIGSLTEEMRNILADIAKVTGATDQPGSYPGKLPKTMLGSESEQIDINSTPEMLIYLFRYLDSILGQYPIDTKIEDADASQEGDQPQTTKIPNISEALAELYGMIFTNAINIKDKRIEVDGITELYFLKKNLFQMKYQIQSIIDWLGFEPSDTTKELKFSINPEERDYNKFLEPTKKEIEVVEFKESKNNKDLRYYLNKLLISATTIQKAFGIPIDPGNIAGSVLNFIKGLGSNPGEEWEQFKEDLEDGKFTDDNLGSSDNPKVSNPTLEDELDS